MGEDQIAPEERNRDALPKFQAGQRVPSPADLDLGAREVLRRLHGHQPTRAFALLGHEVRLMESNELRQRQVQQDAISAGVYQEQGVGGHDRAVPPEAHAQEWR